MRVSKNIEEMLEKMRKKRKHFRKKGDLFVSLFTLSFKL